MTEWLPFWREPIEPSGGRVTPPTSSGCGTPDGVPHPVQTLRLPGTFVLPEDHGGTLLLWDASRLTLDQQIRLNDWMGVRRVRTQVISVTTTPLLPLVEDGRFLEGLYYRMNVVSLFAQEGQADSTGPADEMLVPAAASAAARVASIYHRRIAPIMIR